MPTQPEIASQIIGQLGIVEPELDLSIGTPTRKVVDTVAEAISEAYVEQYFAGYQYDIDTLSGASLDSFLSRFGFTRFAAIRATGNVTFTRPTPATSNILIPAGTIVSNSASPPITFSTIVSSILPLGGVSISIPIQAVVGGLAGNLPANTITMKVTPLNGISNLANTVGTSGGADAESDDAVKARFKKTALRGFTGTEQMFLGTALEQPQVIQANVVGSSKTNREQIQIVGGVGTSTLRSAKYVYPDNYFLGPNLDSGNILNPEVHYHFSSGGNVVSNPNTAPTVVYTGGGSLNAPYSFVYTGIVASGETLPSPIRTVYAKSTSTGQFAVTVPAITGVTQFNIYVQPPVLVGGQWVAGGVWYKWATLNNTVGLAIPTITSASTSPQGGSLAPGTYYYRLTAVSPNGGETLPSPEFSVIVPAGTNTNVIQLNWNMSPGSAGYNMYGRAQGAEQLLTGTGRDYLASVPAVPGYDTPGAARLNVTVSGNALLYVDAGKTTPNGSLPNADTTTNSTIFNLAALPSATPTTLPYVNNTGYQPTITSLDSANCPDGIYDLQFEYLPIASRNDPLNGITNRVDLFVQGTLAQSATETISFSTAYPFNSTAGDPYNASGYQRLDGSIARVNNFFQKLTFGPVTQLPATIQIGSSLYTLNVDYFLINDITNTGGTAHSRSGIEWATVAGGASIAPPSTGTQIQINYSYNSVPRTVETSIITWRLVSYDVQVHQAKQAYINVYLVVVLAPGFTIGSIQSSVQAVLSTIFSAVGFDGVLVVSDILAAVAGVPGVEAVRMATSSDDPYYYALQRVSSTGTLLNVAAHNGRAYDLIFSDDTVPVLNTVNIKVKAANTYWGADNNDLLFTPPGV